jgi:restriction endonuclease
MNTSEQVFNQSWQRPYFGLFMEMGTGKSKVAIDTMGALYEARQINTALIIAPKGSLITGSRKKSQHIYQTY